MKKISLLVFIFTFFTSTAQDSISKVKVDISGFIDTYYSYDFDQPETKHKQSFLYNYNRQNSFNVNIALLRAAISYENVYAKISVHAGTYVEDNYVSENIKYINEAYLGLYLNKSKSTTLEAGILPSYIGFESATTHINLTTTRSILAENSPYYVTGVKLNHQFNNKWSLAGLITNGWQHIEKPKNNLMPAFGTQLVFKPNDSNTINWSTFVGDEMYDNEFNKRYFSNLYWDKIWNNKWHSILGFDYGIQDSETYTATWFSPVLINQYTFNQKWQMAHRFEYYNDRKNVLISNAFPFETIGNSINVDFLPNSKFKIRTEGKWYHATENNFNLETKKDNFSITTTMSFEF